MDNYTFVIELTKAIMWPIAYIALGLCFLLSIRMVTSRRADVNISLWESVKISMSGTSRVTGTPALDQIEAKIDTVDTPNSPPARSESGNESDTVSESKESASPFNFLFAKSLSEMEASYKAFRQTEDNTDDELWTTIYTRRRVEFGMDFDEVERLLTEHPSWVAPLIILIRRAIDNDDLAALDGCVSRAAPRFPSEHADWVLSEATKGYYRLQGASRALSFVVTWVKSELPTQQKARLLFAFSQLLVDDKKIHAANLIAEIALTMLPRDSSNRFSLAYRYGQTTSHWPAAIYHYEKLKEVEGQVALAQNNLGVLVGALDKSLQIESYERASAGGNVLAATNLARRLVEEGFISAADRALAIVAESTDEGESIAAAKLEILSARRRNEEKELELGRLVSAQYDVYRAIATQAFRRVEADAAEVFGLFETSDGLARASIDTAGAACEVVYAGETLSGILYHEIVCYAGILSSKGQNFLSRTMHEAILVSTTSTTIRLLLWPTAMTLNSRIETFELRKVASPPRMSALPDLRSAEDR